MNQKNLLITIAVLVVIVIVGAMLFSNSPATEEVEQDEAAQQAEQTTQPATYTPPVQNSSPSVPETKTTIEGTNLIRYTSSGFVPDILEIKRGESIAFRNDTNKELLVTTRHPALGDQSFAFPDSPLLLQGNGWELSIIADVGTYSFVNDYNENHIGVLVVQPQ